MAAPMFSPELVEKICDRIADGESLRKVCETKGMPHRITFLRWMSRHPEAAKVYALAREMQADALEEDMADIEDKTLSGKVDPVAARTVLSSKQWRAAKLAPKKYGEKLDMHVTGSVNIAQELARRRAKKADASE